MNRTNDPKSVTIGVPLSETQVTTLRHAAEAAGMPLATWMRRACLGMAKLEADLARTLAGRGVP